MGRVRDPLLSIPSTIDVLYIGAFIVAFGSFIDVSSIFGVVAYLVITASVYIDWRSARVADIRPHWYFVVSDFFTVFNYIALFRSFSMKGGDIEESFRIWLHWGMIFVIYIAWNVVMASLQDTDKESKQFFVKYALMELPLALLCFLVAVDVYFGGISFFEVDILSGDIIFVVMAVICFCHALLLLSWFHQTYIQNRR